MFTSSVPVERALTASRLSMMNSALERTASVTAICNAIRVEANLFRASAARTEAHSINIPSSLHFQLRGRLDSGRAPGGIQSRQQGDGNREQYGNRDVCKIKV